MKMNENRIPWIMTTVGKGRGRGRNTEEPTLRKPEPPYWPRDELIERIRGIDINDVATIRDSSSPLSEIVRDRNDLKDIAKLYNEALEDRSFISHLLAIFENPSNNFPAFLTILQPDYEDREDFFKRSPSRFLNFVYLMGEVLQRPCKFLPGPMYTLFISAVINLCKILLESGEEDEIEVVMNQIWLNGERLNAAQPKELAELLNQIKGVLISKNLSTRSRAMLLYSIEIAHNNCSTALEADLQKFYESNLGKSTIDELLNRRNLAAISEARNSEPRIPELKIPERQSPPRFNPNKNPKKTEEKEPHKHPQPNQARPRAIRGSGVNGSRDEEKKNTRDSSSNWSDGKKGWGHDDRFERDY
ncbi:uncharacterized protein [Fopius arisanus]|uniref:Uncharacterized protein isoform X1 n=1 Tax=Fopius arisanus TaxID=64838 RepID=A0A9R1T2V2_9HYME|nr:PREDICTED: uncharacterized protein LOC105265731 isoform X1 [Fopius arisanus]